jgi:hypothetical protein
MGTKKDRQEYVFMVECLRGEHDISDASKRSRWCRRLLTKILDRWQADGSINWYHIRKGRTTTHGDAFSYVHCEDMGYTFDDDAKAGYFHKDRSKRGRGVQERYTTSDGTFIEVDFFVGADILERVEPQYFERCSMYDNLTPLPPVNHVDRKLEHGKPNKHPFHMTMFQRVLEDRIAHEKWLAEQLGEQYRLSLEPDPVVEPEPEPEEGDVF